MGTRTCTIPIYYIAEEYKQKQAVLGGCLQGGTKTKTQTRAIQKQRTKAVQKQKRALASTQQSAQMLN